MKNFRKPLPQAQATAMEPMCGEETRLSEKIQIERKLFLPRLQDNPRGRFLRITEAKSGRPILLYRNPDLKNSQKSWAKWQSSQYWLWDQITRQFDVPKKGEQPAQALLFRKPRQTTIPSNCFCRFSRTHQPRVVAANKDYSGTNMRQGLNLLQIWR